MSFIEYHKYDFDFYLQDGVLTPEQVEELRPLSDSGSRVISKLQGFICDRDWYQRYNEYFKDVPIASRGNVTLEETKVDEKIIQEIQREQTYHLNLLNASKIISEKEREKIQSFIDRKIFKKLIDLFILARTYQDRKRDYQTVKKRMDQYFEENLLTSVPLVSNQVLDSFDFVKHHTYHKIFDPKDYLNEQGAKNVTTLLQDIISFLPDKENFGKVFIETREDGREIYYSVKKDLMITIIYNGKPISLRSHINFKYFDGNMQSDFRPEDNVWKFSEAADIFNKIYGSLGIDYRLFIVSDRPVIYNNPHNENSRFAIVVESQKLGRIPWICSNQKEPEYFKYTEKEIDELVDNMKNVGLFQSYSSEEIEHARHLGKTNFIYSTERILWFFDYFVMAICPRESHGYKYFMEIIPKMIGGKILLQDWYEDIEKGILGFTLNGKKYETDQLLKNQCDPFFILFLNEALQEQGLGKFYHWQNDFDPHEQFSIIFSTPDVMEKILAWQYPLPRFSELEKENIKFWR